MIKQRPEAGAQAEEKVQENKKEQENLRNDEGAQEKGKAKLMATLLSAPLLPTRLIIEESHLRAKRIALLALTTLKENSTKGANCDC